MMEEYVKASFLTIMEDKPPRYALVFPKKCDSLQILLSLPPARGNARMSPKERIEFDFS